jgi:hypothetical protein
LVFRGINGHSLAAYYGVASFTNIETTMSDLGAATGRASPRMTIMQYDWPNGVDSRSTNNERE